MAYTRRYKKTIKKGRMSYTKGATSALALAKQALKDIWYLKGLVNSEMMKNDVASSTTIANTGSIIRMVDIAQGDADGQRTGNSILLRGINLKLVFTQNVSATDTLYRIILFQDTQQVADTNPAVADVLESVSTLAPLNSESVGRFKIMKNWFFHTSNSSDTVKHVKYYLNLRQHMRYNGTASTDYQKGGIYLLILSDQGTNTPTMFYNKRVYYHDN